MGPLTLENIVEENAAGVWGGTCTCPDGQVYNVGDAYDYCESLACEGGVSSECHQKEGPWTKTKAKVTCLTEAPPTELRISQRDVLDASPQQLGTFMSMSSVAPELRWDGSLCTPHLPPPHVLCFEVTAYGADTAGASCFSFGDVEAALKPALPALFSRSASVAHAALAQPGVTAYAASKAVLRLSGGFGFQATANRERQWERQPSDRFFRAIHEGRHCQGTNWYEGSATGNFGAFWRPQNPALLGFDNDIAGFCGGGCDGAGYNILNLFGHVPYNMCRNFEWQMCAALGLLPDQNTREIKFAWPPKTLSMAPDAGVFGSCHGYTDAPCDQPWVGFANDDIYYLEVCLFAQVCSTRDRLFEIDRDDAFICEIDDDAFAELQSWLVSGPA